MTSAGAMPLLLDQVQDDAGVELAGAGAHRQAVEGGEAHGALDAAAGEQRAHRGAAAEVGDDHPAAGDLGRDLGEAAGDVLVAEAVEAVAADALVVERARQGVAVGVLGVAAVEGGVEAGDLRQVGVDRRDEADGGEVVRLVQRRQRLERGQPGEDVGVDAAPGGRSRGRRARRGGRRRGARAPPRPESQARSASVAAGRSGSSAASQRPVDEDGAVGVGGAEARADADAVDLAADPALERRRRRRRPGTSGSTSRR